MSDAHNHDQEASPAPAKTGDEHEDPNDNRGNRVDTRRERHVDDDIGNRLLPEEAEPQIDDDIGNRASGAPNRGPRDGAGNREGGSSSGRRRRRRRGRRGGDQPRREGEPGERGERSRRPPRRQDDEIPPARYVLKSDPEEKRARAEEVCTEIVRLSQRQAKVKAELVDEGGQPKVVVLVDEEGDDPALFTRNSAALSALNFLTNKVVNRFPDDRIRLVVHVNAAGGPPPSPREPRAPREPRGPREPREPRELTPEELTAQEMAKHLAEHAQRLGRVLSIAPLPPDLRRIVHVTLENDTDVVTMSEGEGSYRKLLVVPKNLIPERPGRGRGGRGGRDERQAEPASETPSVAGDEAPVEVAGEAPVEAAGEPPAEATTEPPPSSEAGGDPSGEENPA